MPHCDTACREYGDHPHGVFLVRPGTNLALFYCDIIWPSGAWISLVFGRWLSFMNINYPTVDPSALSMWSTWVDHPVVTVVFLWSSDTRTYCTYKMTLEKRKSCKKEKILPYDKHVTLRLLIQMYYDNFLSIGYRDNWDNVKVIVFVIW